MRFIWTTLNTLLYCTVQIEHQQFFIIPWHHSDGTTIYCLSVSDKEQSSVQCCCISLWTQQSQSPGKFSHWDAQGWFLFSHVYFCVNCRVIGCTWTWTLVEHLTYSIIGKYYKFFLLCSYIHRLRMGSLPTWMHSTLGNKDNFVAFSCWVCYCIPYMYLQ